MLPRIKMTRTAASLPFSITRVNFPVKLSFAMTINKAQGQTFNRVGVLLKEPVFSHGQLYVAFSRVRRAENLRIQVEKDCMIGKEENGVVKVKNVVFSEILDEDT